MHKVSLVTISHYNRVDFLKVLVKCIKNQDYKNIIEWVIVDTSFTGYYPTKQDLQELIVEFREDKSLPKIIYFKSNKKTIGGWRNESNDLVTGDIIVCMDDDEYYPPQRVSHAVEKLADKKALIAGSDKMYFYDIHFKKIYFFKGVASLAPGDDLTYWKEYILNYPSNDYWTKYLTSQLFNGIGPHHSTNNCMAYWRDYLTNHTYDEAPLHAEEASFTKNFMENMVQLDADKTVLQFSHDSNTYNKKRVILQQYYIHPKYVEEVDNSVEKIISNDEIYQDYMKIFKRKSEPQESPYDIVYLTGVSSIQWSPLQKDLGGSEHAVVQLSTEWVRLGKKVAVFGNFVTNEKYQGVDYFKALEFRFWDKYKTLILWRQSGCYPYLDLGLSADKILVDVHNHIPEFYQLLLKHESKISHWMLKSEFHLELIELFCGKKIKNAVVIPNGIRIQDFSKQIDQSRNPFRMCYCSCYTRGLYRILNNIWPLIYKLEPRAELHVYYGMDLISDQNFKNEIQLLLSQHGVMDHGRQPVEIINREKRMSTFQFYYTDSLMEIDCISIRESLVAGCIPIISDINLYKFRDGIKLQWLPNSLDFNRQIATTIIELMHDTSLQEELRQKYYQSKTIVPWHTVAKQWLNQ